MALRLPVRLSVRLSRAFNRRASEPHHRLQECQNQQNAGGRRRHAAADRSCVVCCRAPARRRGWPECEGDAVRVQHVPQQCLRVGEHMRSTASEVADMKADVEHHSARGGVAPRAHCSRNALAVCHFGHRLCRQRGRRVGILAGRNGEGDPQFDGFGGASGNVAVRRGRSSMAGRGFRPMRRRGGYRRRCARAVARRAAPESAEPPVSDVATGANEDRREDVHGGDMRDAERGEKSGTGGIVHTPGKIQTAPAAPHPKIASAAITVCTLDSLLSRRRNAAAPQATASSAATTLMRNSKASPSSDMPLIHAYNTANRVSPTGAADAELCGDTGLTAVVRARATLPPRHLRSRTGRRSDSEG